MHTGDILLECNPAMDQLASHPGGSSNTPRHASYEGNQNYKLLLFGPLTHVWVILYTYPLNP